MSGVTRRAVVVGLSARTGAAVAARLLADGWRVRGTVRSDVRAEESRRRFAPEIDEGRLQVDRLDLSELDAVEAYGAGLAEEDAIDLLTVAAAPFEERAWSEVRGRDLLEQATVQAVAPAMLARTAAAPLVRGLDGAGGAVVFFGDIHARLRPRAGATPYLAGKALVESLVPLLALEMAPVRVFGVAPGVIAWADEFDEARRAAYLSRVPLGREGTLEEAARLVESLALDFTYTTGLVVPVDGGRSLR